jgi:hypothetical protein
MTKEQKSEKFKLDLKQLLLEYGAEICLENFGNKWGPEYKIVVDFNDFSPQIMIGNFINGEN